MGAAHLHEAHEKEGQLLEDEEWIVDDKGNRKR